MAAQNCHGENSSTTTCDVTACGSVVGVTLGGRSWSRRLGSPLGSVKVGVGGCVPVGTGVAVGRITKTLKVFVYGLVHSRVRTPIAREKSLAHRLWLSSPLLSTDGTRKLRATFSFWPGASTLGAGVVAKIAVVCPAEIHSPADRHGLLLRNPILDRAVTLVLHLNQEQGAPVVNPTRSLRSIDRRHAKVLRERCEILRQCRRSGRCRRRHRWGGRRDGHRLGLLLDGVVRHDDAQHIGGRDRGFHDLGAGRTRNGFPVQVDRFDSTHGPGQRRRLTGEDRGRVGYKGDVERLRDRRGRRPKERA